MTPTMRPSDGSEPSSREPPPGILTGHREETEMGGEPAGATSAGPTRVEIWFHRVMAASLFLDASGATMVAPFFPAFSRLFHLGQQSIALLLGIRSITAILMILPIGLAFRFVGHRIVLATSFAIAIAASGLLAFPQSWQMIAVALFVQGLCTQTVRSGSASFTTTVFAKGAAGGEDGSERERKEDDQLGGRGERTEEKDAEGDDSTHAVARVGKVAGMGSRNGGSANLVGALGVLYCWTSMGGVAGPVIGSLLYQYAETWLPFTILGACSFVMAIVILSFKLPRQGGYKLALQGQPKDDPSVELGESKASYAKLQKLSQNEAPHSYRGLAKLDSLALHADATETKREIDGDMVEVNLAKGENGEKPTWTLGRTWKTILGDRIGLAVMYIACTQSMAWGVYEVVVPYFLTEKCDFETAEIGVAFGINNFVYAVVAFWAGSVISRLGSSRSIISGVLILSISLPLMTIKGFSCHFLIQYPLNGLNGLGFALIETPLLACLTEVAEGHGMREYGILVAIYQIAFSTGYALAPFFAAALFTTFISVGVMGVTAIWLMLGLCIWLWANSKRRVR